MEPFIYTALPARVVFGSGTLARVADEIRRLGRTRALVLSTPQQIREAQAMADPRPHIYFPLGASAAVDQLGRNTLVAIGSYDGLVMINFNRMVDGKVAPTGGSASQRTALEQAPVRFEHLVIALEDREGFLQAVKEACAGASQSSSTNTASVPLSNPST